MDLHKESWLVRSPHCMCSNVRMIRMQFIMFSQAVFVLFILVYNKLLQTLNYKVKATPGLNYLSRQVYLQLNTLNFYSNAGSSRLSVLTLQHIQIFILSLPLSLPDSHGVVSPPSLRNCFSSPELMFCCVPAPRQHSQPALGTPGHGWSCLLELKYFSQLEGPGSVFMAIISLKRTLDARFLKFCPI